MKCQERVFVMKEVNEKEIKKEIQCAMDARKKSYAPYSKFHVGACLKAKSGHLYTGCNIENAAYTPTNCAERTAFFKAVSEGEQEFVRITIVGGKEKNIEEFCPPCGVCRQVMMEFCSPEDFTIILAKSIEEYKVYQLKELLPMGFGRNNVG